MKVKNCMTALVLAALSTGIVADAKLPPVQLGIAPPRIELALDAGVSNESITIYNYSEKAKTIDLELINLSKIPNGKSIPPGPQTLSRWTLFNPKRFTIPPGESQTVRMSIRPRTKLAPGTRYGMLSIRQDMVAKDNQTSTDGEKMTVSIGSSYGLPVIIHVP